MKLTVASLCLGAISLSSCYRDANGFVIPTYTINALSGKPSDSATLTTVATTSHQCNRQTSKLHVIMPTDIDFASLTDSMASSSFHLSAVEVFDGSSIVDPVVVSSSFWSGLQRQIVSVLLGQFIASIAFAILASFLAPQLSALRDAVLSKFTKNDAAAKKSFVKADAMVRPEPDFGKLLVCLLIDIIGTSSEALPIVGELSDILTAPAAALVLQNLFPGSSRFVFLFEFAEEILPLTDFIPFATICWVVDAYYPESSVADVFQLGDYRSSTLTGAEKAESLDVSTDTISGTSDKNTKT